MHRRTKFRVQRNRNSFGEPAASSISARVHWLESRNHRWPIYTDKWIHIILEIERNKPVLFFFSLRFCLCTHLQCVCFTFIGSEFLFRVPSGQHMRIGAHLTAACATQWTHIRCAWSGRRRASIKCYECVSLRPAAFSIQSNLLCVAWSAFYRSAETKRCSYSISDDLSFIVASRASLSVCFGVSLCASESR